MNNNNDNNNNNNNNDWHKVDSIYPPVEEIAFALQDEGKEKVIKRKSGEIKQHKFALIEKLARKVYSNIMKEFNNPDGLTKNVSRGTAPLYKEIILKRRHVDTHETNVFFHQFGKNGKVFLLANDIAHCGLELCIQSFQDYVRVDVDKRNSSRTSNDGLRLACIMLDSKF